MKTIHKADDLKNAILELEAKKIVSEESLKKQFHETVETFKPANILKNTVSEVSASPQFKNNILNHNGWFVLEHTPANNYKASPHFKSQRNYGTTVFSIFINN